MNIFGPSAIIYSINKKVPLPVCEKPRFSMSMMNLKICTSSLAKGDKFSLFDKIEMMGGQPCRDLIDSVNVLITTNVRSHKYLMASKCKMKVLKPCWIDSIWSLCERNAHIDIFSDSFIRKFKIPVFNNLNICLSGYNVDDKKKFMNAIVSHGGNYYIDLKNNEVDYLITNNTQSQKYEYAVLWQIIVVKIDWLMDSISKGYCQDDTTYRFNASNVKSNKDKCLANEFGMTLFKKCKVRFVGCDRNFVEKWTKIISSRCGEISTVVHRGIEDVTHVIVGDNVDVDTAVDLDTCWIKKEWLQKSLELGRLLSVDKFLIGNILPSNLYDDQLTINEDAEDIEGNEDQNVGNVDNTVCGRLFDDVIKNQLTGHVGMKKNPIKLNRADDDVKMSVTTEISGDKTFIGGVLFRKCNVAFIGCHLDFVTKWTHIIRCMGGNVYNYSQNDNITHVIVEDNLSKFKAISEGVYLTKKWLEMSLFYDKLESVEKYRITSNTSLNDETELISQADPDDQQLSATTVASEYNETIVFDSGAQDNGVFANLSFFLDMSLTEADTKELIDSITNLGGKITNQVDKSRFIITKMIITHPYKCFESVSIVTDYFVMDCIAKDCILSVTDNFLYSPLIIDENSKYILKNCVLFIAGFSEAEKLALKFYSTNLGAIVKDVIIGKVGQTTNICSTTHVITNNNCSRTEDIQCVVKLKVPIVAKEWLAKCGHSKSMVDVKEYIIKSDLLINEHEIVSTIPYGSNTKLLEFRPLSDVIMCFVGIISDDVSAIISNFHTLGGKIVQNNDINSATHVICTATLKPDDVRMLDQLNKEVIHLVSLDWLEVSVANKERCKESEYVIDIQELSAIKKMSEVKQLNALISTNISASNGLKRANSSNFPQTSSKICKLSNCLSNEEFSLEVRNKCETMVDWGYEISGDGFSNDAVDECESAQSVEVDRTSRPIKVSISINPLSWTDIAKRIFSLSSMTIIEKEEVERAIESLGGSVSESSMMSDDSDYLICTMPSRSEKYLSAMAAGKWILHPSYVYECLSHGAWQQEDQYEWGSPLTRHYLDKVDDITTVNMALAAYMWRQRGGHAFRGWTVYIVYSSPRLEKIVNIFRLGGARIMTTEEYESNPASVTHAFCKFTQESLPKQPLSLNHRWLKLELIPNYLSDGSRKVEKDFQFSAAHIRDFNCHIVKALNI